MVDSDNRLLGPAQRKVAGVAVTFLSTILILGLTLVVFLVLQKIVSFFSGVIWPLAVAGILALILRPVVHFFEVKLKLGRIKSIVLLYVLVILVALGMLAFIVPIIVGQVIDFVSYAPKLFHNARDFVTEHFPQIWKKLNQDFIDDYMTSFLEGLKQLAVASMPAIREAGAWVIGLFGLSAALAIIPIYLFYFLETDRDPTKDIDDQLSFLNANLRGDIIFLIREFANILVAFFRGQLLIGIIMGLLLAVGFSFAGLKFGLVLGITIGLLNIVPYLGTILGLSVALPIAFFQPDDGGWLTLALTVGVFIGVQVIEGYLLTPRIMGKQTGLHPMVIIIAIFFWGTALNGVLGMVLAVPLTAFFIIAWRLVKRKYLSPEAVGA